MQPMIKTGMTNKQVHQMKKKKTEPGTMGNDSIHLPKKAAKAKAKMDDSKECKTTPKRKAKDYGSTPNESFGMKRKGKKSAKGFAVKTSGTFQGKSNQLGHGGRAAQMKAHGVPGAVIGAIARAEGAAPGQPNYHGGKPGMKAKK